MVQLHLLRRPLLVASLLCNSITSFMIIAFSSSSSPSTSPQNHINILSSQNSRYTPSQFLPVCLSPACDMGLSLRESCPSVTQGYQQVSATSKPRQPCVALSRDIMSTQDSSPSQGYFALHSSIGVTARLQLVMLCFRYAKRCRPNVVQSR